MQSASMERSKSNGVILGPTMGRLTLRELRFKSCGSYLREFLYRNRGAVIPSSTIKGILNALCFIDYCAE